MWLVRGVIVGLMASGILYEWILVRPDFLPLREPAPDETKERVPEPSWKPLYRRALGEDRFLDRWCARCGHEGTAWADGEGGIALRCPRCLRERVRALRQAHGELPGAVDHLETMARGDLKRQSLEDRSGLTVEFDVFSRCARCDRLIQRKDARHWRPPGTSSSPPYCRECHGELSAGGER